MPRNWSRENYCQKIPNIFLGPTSYLSSKNKVRTYYNNRKHVCILYKSMLIFPLLIPLNSKIEWKHLVIKPF